MLFKERLVEQRLALNLTKKEVAEKINVEQSTYGKYELGQRQPSLEILQKLANYFGVTTDYLLGESDNANPSDENAHSDDVWELREHLHKRPEMKILFDATKSSTKDDILKAVKIIEALKNDNFDE